MTDRLRCSVPFCKRTRHNREGFTHWICGEHWRGASKRMRRLHSLAKRRKRFALASWLWFRCLDEAIERAGGIG